MGDSEITRANYDDFELISVCLKKMNCELLIDGYSGVDGKVEIFFKFNVVKPSTRSDDLFDFVLPVTVKMSGTDQEGEKIFEVECTFDGGFKCYDESCDSVEKFTKLVPVLSKQVFPVVRSYLSDSLNKMGLSGVFLPWSFRFSQLGAPPEPSSE